MKYAGIGSRKVPHTMSNAIATVADIIAERGGTLRSGGADGCDEQFEMCTLTELQEIYVPWNGFNGRHSHLGPHIITPEDIDPAAAAIADSFVDKFHPFPNKLGIGARSMMRRNAHQVFGRTMDDPVDFIVCWATGSVRDYSSGAPRIVNVDGGTGQAVRIAAAHNIPVFNLIDKSAVEQVMELVHGYT